jgi:spore germination protein GerM
MDRKRVATLGILFVVLVVLVIVFFKSGLKEKIITTAPISPPEVEPLSIQPGQTRIVILFFLSENDTLLHPEEREIPTDTSVVHQAKRTIQELVKGSQRGFISPFPPETKLIELHVTDEGVAYVDFSKDIVEKHLSGSSAEISTIFSVVNSLAYNFSSIEKVFILIEGRERETLGGHINLSRPFLPLYDLIAQ